MLTPEAGEFKERAVFADWHPELPADPVFLRRVRKMRVERFYSVVVVLVACALAEALLYRLHSSGASWWGVTGGATYLAYVWRRRARPDTAYLFDVPPVVPQFPVDMELWSGNIIVGTDAGAISFVGSRLRFEGRSTCFELEREDIRCQPSWQTEGSYRRSRKTLCLFYGLNRRIWKVVIKPYDKLDGVGEGFLLQFGPAVSAWSSSSPEAGCRSLYPPKIPQERQLRAYRSWIRAGRIISAVSLGPLLTCIPFLERSPYFGSGLVVSIASVVIGIAVSLTGQYNLNGARELVPPRLAMSRGETKVREPQTQESELPQQAST
jgi:hypothetical protein